jgi:hypothetical protein
MKMDCGMIKMLNFYPAEEVKKVIDALELAVDKKDMETLLWCGRRVLWFYERAELNTCNLSGDMQCDLFDEAYKGSMEAPPPALIADLVAPDEEENIEGGAA